MTANEGAVPDQGFLTPDVVYPQELSSGTETSEIGRFRKFGNAIVELPGYLYERAQYASLAFQNDPVHFAKRTFQGAILTLELLPTNEAIRYGALAYALSNTGGGPLVGAAVLGGTSFVVEASAALATSELITTGQGTKVINKVNKGVDRVFPNGVKMSPIAEVGVAMMGGSAIVLAEKQRENPNRTVAENKKHGLLTASWMAGYFALEGAFIAENTDTNNIFNAKTIGAAALAIAVSWTGSKWAIKRGRKNQTEQESEVQ